jgi:hypothetical protein
VSELFKRKFVTKPKVTVFTAILLPMLFRFWVYFSAFPPQMQTNRRSLMFTAIPLNISSAILWVAPPFKKIACFSATL